MTRLTHFLTLLIFLGTLVQTKGQSVPDPHFSQFYANQLYLNPALAGSSVCPRLNLGYRNQWPSLPNNYVSYSAAFDMYVDKIRGGVGVYFLGDNAGDLMNTYIVSAIYSYRLQVGNWTYINFALEGSFIQTSLKWENLIFGDMIDPNLGVVNPTSEVPPDNTNVSYPDFDAGISFSFKGNIYGGLAVHHLTEPNNSFYSNSESKLYRKYTVHGGVFIDLNGRNIQDESYGNFAISPNFLYMQQNNFHQLNVGLYINYKPFIAGAWFRHNFENADAIVPMIGIEWRGLKVGYSYDITISNLKTTTGGAHEVSLGWQFSCPDQKRRRIKAINCPRF